MESAIWVIMVIECECYRLKDLNLFFYNKCLKDLILYEREKCDEFVNSKVKSCHFAFTSICLQNKRSLAMLAAQYIDMM